MSGRFLPYAVIVVVVIATRWVSFGNPVAGFDEQLYSLIGLKLSQGFLPYVDYWDRKPLGLFALFAFAHAIGGPSAAAYQILAALFCLAGAALTYQIALTLSDRLTSTVAGSLYAFLMFFYGSHSGQSEIFFVPLILAAILFLVRNEETNSEFRNCMAMLMCGLALQVKYTVLPQCLVLGLWCVLADSRTRLAIHYRLTRALIYFGLGLLPTGVVASYYFITGFLDEWAFANLFSFFDRIALEGGRISKHILIFSAPLIWLIFIGLYSAIRLKRPIEPRIYWLFVVWMIGAIGTVFLPGTFYDYYLAALVAPAVLVSVPILDRRGPLGLIPILAVAAIAIWSARLADRREYSQYQAANAFSLASEIAPYVDSGECLFVFDGPTSFYRMTGSCLPTRFIYPDHLNNALEKNALGISQEEEVARILAEQPPVIVTSDTPVTVQNDAAGRLVRAAIAADYQRLGEAEILDRTTRAWVRRDIAQSSLHSSRSAHGPDD